MLMPSLDPPGVLSFDWNRYNCATIGGSAVLGFLLQWSGALALGYVFCFYLDYCFFASSVNIFHFMQSKFD